MKTLKQTLNIINEDEKEDWFVGRTKRHIDLVKKYCKRIYLGCLFIVQCFPANTSDKKCGYHCRRGNNHNSGKQC